MTAGNHSVKTVLVRNLFIENAVDLAKLKVYGGREIAFELLLTFGHIGGFLTWISLVGYLSGRR